MAFGSIKFIIYIIMITIGIVIFIASFFSSQVTEWLTSITIGEGSPFTLNIKAILGSLASVIEFISNPLVGPLSILSFIGLGLIIAGILLSLFGKD